MPLLSWCSLYLFLYSSHVTTFTYLFCEHNNYDHFVLVIETWFIQVENSNKFIHVLKSAQQLLVVWLLYVFETKAHKDYNSKCLLPFMFQFLPFLHFWFNKWGIFNIFCKHVLMPTLSFLAISELFSLMSLPQCLWSFLRGFLKGK